MLATATPAPRDPTATPRRSTLRWARPPRTIALPRRSDGWSAECRLIVRYAAQIAVDTYSPGDALPAVVVPALGDLLLGAGDLAFRRDDLSPADVLIALRSAMMFCGIESGIPAPRTGAPR